MGAAAHRDFLSPVGHNFAAWLVFVALSILVSLLPLAAVLSTLSHFKYENALQEVFRGAYEWCDLRNVDRRRRGQLGDLSAASPQPAAATAPKKMATKDAESESARLLDVDDPDNDNDANDDSRKRAMDKALQLTDSKSIERLDEIEVGTRSKSTPERVPEIPFDTHGADRTAPMISSDIQTYIDQFLIPQAPTMWTRLKAIPEALVCVPVAGFMFGFLPELYCQTVQLWRTSFHFTVSAKPTSGSATNV